MSNSEVLNFGDFTINQNDYAMNQHDYALTHLTSKLVKALMISEFPGDDRLCYSWTVAGGRNFLNKTILNLAFCASTFSVLSVKWCSCWGDEGVTSGDFSLPRALAPSESVNVE